MCSARPAFAGPLVTTAPARAARSLRRQHARRRRERDGDGDRRAAAAQTGHVYLTFDDGPDPRWTPAVLEELARLGLHATFFVVGERAARHPGLLERTAREGHDVELHCMRHDRHTQLTRQAVEQDTREALGVLADAGIRPTRWRPPFGVADWWTDAVATAHRLRVTGWSVDPRDSSGARLEAMLATARTNMAPGRVVIMHDGVGAGAMRSDCAGTVELIEPLVAEIEALGCEPAPLSTGPAFWWTRTASPPPRGVQLEVLEEDELRGADREAVNTLLAENITRHRDLYRRQGWRTIRPAFRVLARTGKRIVGQGSVMEMSSEPARRAFGMGDGVVDPRWRGLGIGTAVFRQRNNECIARGADMILTDTVAHVRLAHLLGWQRVPRFAISYERAGACCWHPHWLWWRHDPERTTRLTVEEGDF